MCWNSHHYLMVSVTPAEVSHHKLAQYQGSLASCLALPYPSFLLAIVGNAYAELW